MSDCLCLLLFIICLLTYLWPHRVFISAQGLSLFVVSRGYFLVVCGLLIVMVSLIADMDFRMLGLQ